MRQILLLLFIIPCLAFAQDPSPPESLEGAELREWLRENWYSPWHSDLGYGPARVAMFGTIDNEAGLIECVYSGFTQMAEQVTFPDPMNTEHTIPQSYFNSQLPMRSDIHHLFPTHMQANGTRGSLAFGEVVDAQADEWLIGSSGMYNESSGIPSSNIDDYSEIQHNVFFEPREEHKGNVARAIFYFFTMYPSIADISVAGELNTLYMWHQNDLPDALEIERNEEIQAAQGNYNPYISRPDLVGTAWGFTSSLESIALADQVDIIIYQEHITINSTLNGLEVALYDITGQQICSHQGTGQISVGAFRSGLYLIQLGHGAKRMTQKIILQ